MPRPLLMTADPDVLDDLLRLAAPAGVEVEVVYEEGMFHVWPLIDMPEARRARDSIVSFLTGEPKTRRTEAGVWSLQGQAAT